MENNFEINYIELAKRDCGLIREIKRALFIVDTKRAGLVVSRVLHTIRRSLTKKESAEFISRLPDYLKILYVTEWEPSEKRILLKHLDEFTEEVITLDSQSGHRVFHKEVDALAAVITIMKVLDQHANLLNFSSFCYSFKRELQETMLETAA
ncbi:hypothetical protein C900_02112 [Fulvivirga imtechensis AK7]|uniref:Uncharacterized protein n=1 Tax=Fulvivirga imtechensis AK7 TaxID=1237149 RepID=L8JZY1_9BACT|nr:DUF2267 domain-containing protein [Fulvivirga imtechensis]ELR73708.1 hypothetical protein C900_02112 [Fulvivirga imtechensis AK7]